MRPTLCLRLAAAIALLTASALAQTSLPQANARIQAAVEAGQAANDQTHAILAARKSLLLELFRTDPALARANALPLATRQALLAADPTTAPLLEYDLTRTGELSASIADNWADGTSTTRYTLHTAAAELDLALPAAVLATAPPNHHLVTVHGLALGDLVAAETLTEASPTEAAACATPTRTVATAGTSSAPLTCATTGNQRIAVLLVKFPAATPAFPAGLDQPAYWNQVLFGANPSVDTYWQEVSQNQTYATGDVYGPFQLAAQYDCTTTSALQTAAIAAAAGRVNFSQYNRVVIVYPVSTCAFGGLGNVGCVGATGAIGHQYSVVWLPIPSSYKANFSYPQMWGGTSHELGHNLGMNHANTLDFGGISLGPLDFSTSNPGTVTGTGAGTGPGSNLAAVNTEYGDTFDVMGYPWISGGPYNAVHRAKTLGWIPPADERDITTSGTYTLVPAENPSGLRALHVLRDAASTSWLWVEFHQPTGYYESGNFTAHLSSGDSETTGAQIHYETPLGPSSYTYLLDMTPVASAGKNNFYDGNLAPGRSWSDPYSLLTLTAGTQTGASLGVTVTYDTPCATVALASPTILAAGGTGTLTLTAPPFCAWTVSSNALWIGFPGATSGSGSAVIPFTATANTTSLQRNTFLTAQRQSVALVQPGSGLTIAGIAPNAGSSAPGVATPFTLAFSDALGLADLSQTNLDFSGFGGPDCQVAAVYSGPSVYLYLLSGGSYTTGIAAGSAGTLTSPSCSLSGAGSSYKIAGNSATLTLGLTFTSAFPGEHNILASAYSYSGTAGNTGTLPLGIWTVTAPSTPLNSTTTTVAASPGSTVYGQPVTLTATVSPATATGSVSFFTNGTPLGSAPLGNGVATLSVTTLPVGTDPVLATYAGDPADAPSTSAAVSVTVAALPASTVVLTPSSSTVAVGANLTLSAAVTPAAATGTVTFYSSPLTHPLVIPIGTGTLASGVATFSTSSLPAGTYYLSALYGGDTNNGTGSSSTVIVNVVDLAGTATTLTASTSFIVPSGSVTLTARVAAASGTTIPTGNLALSDNGTLVATLPLVNGAAAYTASGLAAAPHTYTALYQGSATAFDPSQSLPVTVTVAKLPTNFALTGTASTVLAGGTVTLTAAPSANIPGSGTLAQTAGTMVFLDGPTALATVTLANGSASFTTGNLAAGPHSFTAVYSGSVDLTGATGGPYPVAAQDFALAAAASVTLNPGTGQSFPLTLTPGSTGLTTAIALTCAGAPAQSTCSVSPSSVTPGTALATATLTLTTTARPTPTPGWLLFPLALVALRRRNRRRLAAALAACTLLLAGCGQGNFGQGIAPTGTPAGTYTLTITGTATAATTLTHTTTLILKIN